MRTVLFGAAAETTRALAEPLIAEGYAPEVRIVEGGRAAEQDIESARDATVVFIHLALGMEATVNLCRRIHRAATGVPPLLAIIGEPTEVDAEKLVAAGTTMVFASRRESIAVRSRFLLKAAKGRAELAQTIADLRASEERNQRLEQEYRRLLERTPLAVFVHRAGTIAWANHHGAELFGVASPSMLVGHGVDLVHESSRPGVEQKLAERMSTADTAVPYEHTVVRHDGTMLHLWLAGMPIMFEGEPASLAFVADVTEKRQLEAQLLASERLAALGRLAASVGHEINNPLTYVLGNLELATRALRHGQVPPDLPEMLEAALSGAQQVGRIVEDLRLFAQRKSEVLTPVDLRAVVDSCLRMTGGELRHRARIVVSFDDVPRVLGSEPRLAQVITNLLLNAAQALPRAAADTHTVTVAARRDGTHVELDIEDTGEGVPPEHLPHVFEPFFTTRTERGGTGLGLAICRTLMAAQNGEIHIASQPGKGTCVTLRLPVADMAAAPHTSDTPRTNVTARRVLLVDDDLQILEVMRRSLAPHVVSVASSGRAALRLLEQGERFDVIVCDLVMPDLSGVEVHDSVRKLVPGFERRIIFMTGGVIESASPSVIATLPNACLHKPFQAAALVDEIERTLSL